MPTSYISFDHRDAQHLRAMLQQRANAGLYVGSFIERIDAMLLQHSADVFRHARKRRELERTRAQLAERPLQVELHLDGSPDFTRKGWARKVKAIGGRYSECRGIDTRRFVTLPASDEGLKLAAELSKAFPDYKGRVLWIGRCGQHGDDYSMTMLPSVVFGDLLVSQFLDAYRANAAASQKRSA